MFRTTKRRTRFDIENQIETLESYLHEVVLIIRSLTEQEGAAGIPLLHARRLSEAKREHEQLQLELDQITEKRNKRFGKKLACWH
ncbi:hypothetical protein [Candidatus Pantoea formicae]|uniref:hypothetical protein n=1 Tax=Candidatus Pantoea formicae TaxID=2608355 RepID=UPI003ED86F91